MRASKAYLHTYLPTYLHTYLPTETYKIFYYCAPLHPSPLYWSSFIMYANTPTIPTKALKQIQGMYVCMYVGRYFGTYLMCICMYDRVFEEVQVGLTSTAHQP